MADEKKTGSLAVTRKVGESVLIGDDTRVTLTRIDANRVGLRITAPLEVNIVREELTLAGKESERCRGR